ncbi:unnamed protein product [Bemisia tabaci]|uniref:Uncharacterized protein n=1 Tax=Bemisia tabaci TaxID=7038 RepID=A0A9P0A5C0_BEMTA|nr:unnamed protein product [Bemisia tabaci]
MPRCLMAKKWKGYPWPTENASPHVETALEEEEEEIDVVTVNNGTSPMPATVWGPSSPTEGATAPSPPPCPDSGRISVHCNEVGKFVLSQLTNILKPPRTGRDALSFPPSPAPSSAHLPTQSSAPVLQNSPRLRELRLLKCREPNPNVTPKGRIHLLRGSRSDSLLARRSYPPCATILPRVLRKNAETNLYLGPTQEFHDGKVRRKVLSHLIPAATSISLSCPITFKKWAPRCRPDETPHRKPPPSVSPPAKRGNLGGLPANPRQYIVEGLPGCNSGVGEKILNLAERNNQWGMAPPSPSPSPIGSFIIVPLSEVLETDSGGTLDGSFAPGNGRTS